MAPIDRNETVNGALPDVGAPFDELARLLIAEQRQVPDPDSVVRLAGRALPHHARCGLTLIRGRREPETVAATDEVVCEVDAIQYDAGEGPCLDAIERSDLVLVADLADLTRWPEFARRCVEHTEVRSMLSVRLALPGGDRAAMNFYAAKPDAFDELDAGVAAMFAPFAALAVRNELQEQEIGNLNVALQGSRQIGTAIGILMSQRLLTSNQAFKLLVEASQHLNRKLRDVAAEVEFTGQLPNVPLKRKR